MKANKTPAEWRSLAIQMRDHSVDLAVAAQHGDAGAVLKASTKLRSACSKCHDVF
jgi:Cytochrome C'